MPDAAISGPQKEPPGGRRLSLLAVFCVIAAAFFSSPAAYGASVVTFSATYTISIAGVTIGRADATSRFTDSGYAAVIKGTTSGVSRLISDASATLLASGRFSSQQVIPVSYNLETSEGDFETHVRMSMRGGAITDLLAIPSLREATDRVPLNPAHKRDIVDPVGAFLVAVDRPGLADGRRICGRTIKIFDGWQRFDVGLSYKQTRLVTGIGAAYDGRVVVCTARYIPVAGHRESVKTTQYMAENKRLEVWYAPIKDKPVLVPYRILIGTKYGDLLVTSTRFVTTGSAPKAEN